MNNIILWNMVIKEHIDRVCRYITHCGRSGIIFNKEKFCFGRKEVKYLKFMPTENSVDSSQDKLKSIIKFPEPKNLTWVWSWYGLVPREMSQNHEQTNTHKMDI